MPILFVMYLMVFEFMVCYIIAPCPFAGTSIAAFPKLLCVFIKLQQVGAARAIMFTHSTHAYAFAHQQLVWLMGFAGLCACLFCMCICFVCWLLVPPMSSDANPDLPVLNAVLLKADNTTCSAETHEPCSAETLETNNVTCSA